MRYTPLKLIVVDHSFGHELMPLQQCCLLILYKTILKVITFMAAWMTKSTPLEVPKVVLKILDNFPRSKDFSWPKV